MDQDLGEMAVAVRTAAAIPAMPASDQVINEVLSAQSEDIMNRRTFLKSVPAAQGPRRAAWLAGALILTGLLAVVPLACQSSGQKRPEPPASASGNSGREGPRQSVALIPHDIKTMRQAKFDIEYGPVASGESLVELWYTDDGSCTWTLSGLVAESKSPASFTAPHEGIFGFQVVARKPEAAAVPPKAGSEPMLWCFVDWHRPRVRLISPEPDASGNVLLKRGQALAINYEAVDENLDDKPISIEYRLANDPMWRAIAVAQSNRGEHLWTVPDSLAGPLFLRVTGRDRAGNLGFGASMREITIVREAPDDARVNVVNSDQAMSESSPSPAPAANPASPATQGEDNRMTVAAKPVVHGHGQSIQLSPGQREQIELLIRQLDVVDASAATQPARVPASQPAGVAVEKTSAGDLTIEPINHSAIRFAFKGRQYYVDPAGKADWAKMPKADAIFITHEHGDHLDARVIEQIKKDGTVIYANAASAKKLPGSQVIEVGQTKQVLDITVEAVPAYNMTAVRLRFHPRDRKDNGYVLTFGEKGSRVYVAGDTEGMPEMKALKDIDIAFLPINLPYTMPPKEAADAARAFKPKILYPYHQGQSDPAEVKKLLEDEKAIEVRVLPLP